MGERGRQRRLVVGLLIGVVLLGLGYVLLFLLSSDGGRTFDGHSDAVTGVAFSPDGHYAAAGSGVVRLWNLPSVTWQQ
jgi:WD40 repeat protein